MTAKSTSRPATPEEVDQALSTAAGLCLVNIIVTQGSFSPVVLLETAQMTNSREGTEFQDSYLVIGTAALTHIKLRTPEEILPELNVRTFP